MRLYLYFLTSLLVVQSLFAQDSLLVGRKYFEDQIYIGAQYNTLLNKPEEFYQVGISTGFHVGFIKDIPLNKNGTVALGFGVGYAYNKYKQNYRIPEFVFEDLLATDNNSFTTHAVEIPFSIRLRKSKATVKPFVRAYFGVKASYLFASKSKYFIVGNRAETNSLNLLNPFQFGPQISIGYGNLNVYAYLGTTNLFRNIPETAIGTNHLKVLKMGLQFYIF
jgi:hypothetical protein